METNKEEGTFKKNFLEILSIICIVFTFFYVIAVTFMQIPEKNQHIVDTVLGFLLGTLATTVVGYWLGSSKSSAKKTELLAATVSDNAGSAAAETAKVIDKLPDAVTSDGAK